MRSLLLALLLAATVVAAEEKYQILSGTADSVTYKERLRDLVAVDGPAFHYTGCPLITRDLPWMPPAAATLQGAKPHCPELKKPRFLTRTAKRIAHHPKVISLLYVGNSLVYHNEIPAMTAEVASREKRPLRVDSVTRSGATLDQLWNETDALKKLWLHQWDYVVIQGGAGTSGPTNNAEAFNEYLTRFADEVRKSGAQPLLYLIWRAPDPVAHNNAAIAAAKRNQMEIVPVGIAWMDLLKRGRFRRSTGTRCTPMPSARTSSPARSTRRSTTSPRTARRSSSATWPRRTSRTTPPCVSRIRQPRMRGRSRMRRGEPSGGSRRVLES